LGKACNINPWTYHIPQTTGREGGREGGKIKRGREKERQSQVKGKLRFPKDYYFWIKTV